MRWNRSINSRILCLFGASCLMLMAVTAFIQYRYLQLFDAENVKAFRKGNLLVQQSVLLQKNRVLDETLTYVLNYKEVTKLAERPGDASSRLVVSGMHTSLQGTHNISRFIIYDTDFRVIAQYQDKGLPPRATTLPEHLRPGFRVAAEKLTNFIYFRGDEGSKPLFAVEYCGATALTDAKDKVIGFVEVALPSSIWVAEVSKLIHCPGALFAPGANEPLFAVDSELHGQIGKLLKTVEDGPLLHRFGRIYYLSDCIPVKGPDGSLLSWLLLTQDSTGQFTSRRRNMVYGTILFLAVSLGSMIGTWLLLRHKIIRPIRAAMEGLTEGAQHLSTVAAEMSSSARAISEGAGAQASSLEETASSLEELASMTRKSAENAGEADRLMQSTGKVAERAQEAFGQLGSSIQEIAEASDQTSNIVKTIDGIAFQTNLLALNASVEAARAGQAGAGFSVVAEEVRNLAMRTAKAARDTSSLIEDTVLRVQGGQERLKALDVSLSEIFQDTVKVGGIVTEIASACNEQAEGIAQLNRAVSQIDEVTQRNAVDAQGSAETAAAVTSRADHIHSQVEILESVVQGSSSGTVPSKGE